MFNNLKFKVIFFGFIFTFFSSFGQSFFLGLFNAPIRNELGITHGEFGSIYASATICSSLLLVWVGKKIDEFQLLYYSLFVVTLLALSSLIFSLIDTVYLLIVGVFLMRFSGQGLMSHTSTTAISRFFERSRGKALSTIWFGLSTAEFILPVLVTYFLAILSWRTIWQGIAITIIILLPIVIINTIKLIKLESREEKKILKKLELKIGNVKKLSKTIDFILYL